METDCAVLQDGGCGEGTDSANQKILNGVAAEGFLGLRLPLNLRMLLLCGKVPDSLLDNFSQQRPIWPLVRNTDLENHGLQE